MTFDEFLDENKDSWFLKTKNGKKLTTKEYVACCLLHYIYKGEPLNVTTMLEAARSYNIHAGDLPYHTGYASNLLTNCIKKGLPITKIKRKLVCFAPLDPRDIIKWRKENDC